MNDIKSIVKVWLLIWLHQLKTLLYNNKQQQFMQQILTSTIIHTC